MLAMHGLRGEARGITTAEPTAASMATSFGSAPPTRVSARQVRPREESPDDDDGDDGNGTGHGSKRSKRGAYVASTVFCACVVRVY